MGPASLLIGLMKTRKNLDRHLTEIDLGLFISGVPKVRNAGIAQSTPYFVFYLWYFV